MLYFHSRFLTIEGQTIYVSRTDWSGKLGYEICTLEAKTDCPMLWEHFFKIGGPKGMMLSSMQSINTRRIEAGILDSGSDFNTSMKPCEVGLDKFVDLKKDGLIGQMALFNASIG